MTSSVAGLVVVTVAAAPAAEDRDLAEEVAGPKRRQLDGVALLDHEERVAGSALAGDRDAFGDTREFEPVAKGLELLVARAGEQGAAAQLVGLDGHGRNLDD
jgi:hypothetical protein